MMISSRPVVVAPFLIAFFLTVGCTSTPILNANFNSFEEGEQPTLDLPGPPDGDLFVLSYGDESRLFVTTRSAGPDDKVLESRSSGDFPTHFAFIPVDRGATEVRYVYAFEVKGTGELAAYFTSGRHEGPIAVSIEVSRTTQSNVTRLSVNGRRLVERPPEASGEFTSVLVSIDPETRIVNVLAEGRSVNVDIPSGYGSIIKPPTLWFLNRVGVFSLDNVKGWTTADSR